ncbi:MAG TPA: hypothetical protein VIC06_11445 [Solirubrobacteraceae bacterium]|jgi:hypothetical protein
MQNHRIDDEQDEDRLSEETRDSGLLDRMLLDSPSYPWSLGEIARELQSVYRAEDSINRLVAAGLVHSSDGFVWPTRAARRASEIGVGAI